MTPVIPLPQVAWTPPSDGTTEEIQAPPSPTAVEREEAETKLRGLLEREQRLYRELKKGDQARRKFKEKRAKLAATRFSTCVDAVEQKMTVQWQGPLYKLSPGGDRTYLDDADRRGELERLQELIRENCSSERTALNREWEEAERLSIARSERCAREREKLSLMLKPGSREPLRHIAEQRGRVEECPVVSVEGKWLRATAIPRHWR